MPGHEKIVSVMIAPVSRLPNCKAKIVRTGSKAFFSACLTIAELSDKPFARAVLM
jgi:hypothetical protein